MIPPTSSGNFSENWFTYLITFLVGGILSMIHFFHHEIDE